MSSGLYNEGLFREGLLRTTNLVRPGLITQFDTLEEALTRFAVNSVEAALALDFIGSEYRTGNAATTFADAFTGTSPKITYNPGSASSSQSTMTNSSGEIVWAPHNLMPYSEDFSNSAWFKQNISFTTQAQAPDGTTTAWEFSPPSGLTDPGSSSLRVRTYDSFSSKAGDKLTWSVFVKPVVTKSLYVGNPDGADVETDVFIALNADRSSGTSYWNTDTASWANVDADHEEFSNSVGNGWYHIGITYTVSADDTTNTHVVYMTNRSFNVTFDPYPSGSELVHIWGAHVYRSDLGGMAPVPGAATGFETYVPTNGAAEYLPRVGHHVYNGSTWVNEGLLIESEARTNLITESTPQSGDLDLSGGSFSYVTCNFTPLSGPGIHFDTTGVVSYSYFTPTYIAADYTLSVFVEMDDGNAPAFGSAASTNSANDFILVLSGTTPDPTSYTVEHFGGSTYRVYGTLTAAAGVGNTGIVKYGTNSTRTFKVTGLQLEAGATPSSYIPTNNSQQIRGGQSLTVPPAEFGWPEPEYIGPNLVDNGEFETDILNWSAVGGGASVAWDSGPQRMQVTAGAGFEGALQTLSLTSGKVYVLSCDYVRGSVSQVRLAAQGFSGQPAATGTAASGSLEIVAVAGVTNNVRVDSGGSTGDFYVDNISVREINPLSVSIQMDGRMTYADDGASNSVSWWLWNGTDDILAYYATDGAYDRTKFQQALDVAQNAIGSQTEYLFSPGNLVPFNIAGRFGSAFVNGAVDGVALTANTAPTALPDLSNTNLQIAHNFMGTIGQFRQFAGDIGETGIVTATNPSTEPTLSLTFDGTASGSFYNLSWSE